MLTDIIKCPCCGYVYKGTYYDDCPNCDWEYEGVSREDFKGANPVTLAEARKLFSEGKNIWGEPLKKEASHD